MSQLRRIHEILKMFGLTELKLPDTENTTLTALSVDVVYTDMQVKEFAYFITNSYQDMQNHAFDWGYSDEYEEALKDSDSLDEWVNDQANGKKKQDTFPEPTMYAQRYAIAAELLAAHEGRKELKIKQNEILKKLGNREQKHDLETERENNGNGRDTER